MIENEKKEFAKVMFLLAETFDGGKAISETKLDLYFDVFKEYSITQIKDGATKMIKHRIYHSFPKPAEIINEIEGDAETKIMEKWLLFKDAIARVGAYRSPSFDDPVLNSIAVEMGGWPKVCEVRIDELHYMEKEFMKLYKVLSMRSDHPTKVLGIVEQTNNANNRESQEDIIAKIGSKSNALQSV